ncbi:peptide/nickel transport system substrate-binding protein [Angulomicrobium tetraedrale]|uniref:Peptide/nickel transport system substrate-binding protein n=2 Tax=Ancylobacter tetraedralis TaxID=217068 RepID=A0A839ZED1_9HYPH|nr:peptide/nickel transport system substrate-binding protein [Ancylobacter tetraedralis]
MSDITRRAFLCNGSIAGAGLLMSGSARSQVVATSLPAPLAGPQHGLAMHGRPLYPPDFTHYASVNPQAPQGGRLVQGVVGSFDSLNPFIVRGTVPPIIGWNVVEALMARSPDEAFTCYGLIARTVETDEARRFVAFTLDPRARFSDGTPVTAEDVLFSFNLLRAKGRPNHRTYYGKVARAEVTGPLSIRFDFAGEDRELPLILALMPVLARHATDEVRFDQTSFTPPLGSGPYTAVEVKPGESVTLARNPAYWGRDLPVNHGNFNVDTLRYDFYRDVNGQFEAFKRGLYDIRFETDPGRWKTGYDIPAVRDGRILTEEVGNGRPKAYSALLFNMRREIFADVRVRAAMVELFDAEWANQNLYFGLFRRNGSFYDASELSALGRPAEPRERELLAPFTDAVLPAVMDGTWRPPASDGSGRDRGQLKRALDLFTEAGWQLRRGTLMDPRGRPFAPEVLVGTKDQERLALAYQSMLRRAGVGLNIRLVDNVQFESRKRSYDYDMVPYIWSQSLSPGNEQAFYFGSEAADTPGTRNFMGLKSPAADAMIAALLAERERAGFVAAVRALDRVLISARFSLPLFYTPGDWIARWRRIERPKDVSLNGTLAESWWRVPGS